ncbi:MAG TPA: glycerophosphodiester phosphodiesterase family protein [Aestuariivirga sp.]|nr:glycerophosphodiester phosphodiesterase family protein [Aestuariivirga sp.]
MTAPALDWLVARPIAHRGLHDISQGILENTASAFAAAIAGGYAIECDLQLTADGEAVVFHDETLERLSPSKGWVKNLTSAEMRKLALRNSSDHIQTLAELLEQVNGKVTLLIELKSHWDGNDALATRALDVLRGYRGPHCLMSFDPDVVEAVRRQSPLTVRGMVADRGIDEYYNRLPPERRIELRNFSHVRRTQPNFISFYFRDLPFAPVTELRGSGCPVISWTIRSSDEAALALNHSDQMTFEGFLP